MRFVIAPDSFKGSLSAKEVAQTVEKAIKKEIPEAEVEAVPIADGGEGTVDAFLYSTGGERIELEATGPMGAKLRTYYGVLGDGMTAVIELAAVAGLTLVPAAERNPLQTTTYGVGECILHALDRGFRKIIVGIGGSATNDGGIGMLQALGATFRDAEGKEVPPFGSSLARVASVDFQTLDPRIREADIRVACDVDNPLCGPKGASHIFGPQKGATPSQVEELDRALSHYADGVEKHLGKALRNMPGAGAAGGIGFAFLALDATLQPGASLVAEAAGLEKRLSRADWLITGEGKTDGQTLHGKAPFYVAQLAKKHNVPAILISGSLDEDLEPLYEHFCSMHAIASGPMSVEACIARAETLLYHKTRNIVRLLKMP
ncbi:glycerate kinase [Bacillaceae bacterium]